MKNSAFQDRTLLAKVRSSQETKIYRRTTDKFTEIANVHRSISRLHRSSHPVSHAHKLVLHFLLHPTYYASAPPQLAVDITFVTPPLVLATISTRRPAQSIYHKRLHPAVTKFEIKMFSACRFALVTVFSLSVAFPRWAAAANQGQATWYHTGMGACGAHNNDEDHVVALSSEEFSRSNHCFKHIVIHHKGRAVDATIVDRCEGCSRFALDLSPGAFKMIAPLDAGTAEVTWEYV